MDKHEPTLLPFIMDMLSREPQMCSSVDDLVENIKDVMLEEHVRAFGSLKRAVEFALELGVNLGIISLAARKVRIPPTYRRCTHKTKVPVSNRIPVRLGRQLVKQRMAMISATKLAAKKRSGGRLKRAKKTAGVAPKK
ncbi:uncharacterized protein LOC6730812 [Drosophila simulans]|uniref:Uncharacterized protein n=2 Tax=Drosophila simulans TaxID=7240 RepID=A0A0J9QUS0_DROSI|nr:uncharacterized protein LOC6730812 [Drosophila simulans]KMY87817.1 uncharacterized protein Dsimw501_GD23204 [Drosophila simulans]